MTPLDYSIVVVNHHHRHVIGKCFESLFALPDRVAFEAVLIDNTPGDGAAEFVAHNFPRVVIHQNTKPRGFSVNVNTGMRTLVRGRYVLLLNPDVVCIPGLLDQLITFMDTHPHAGIAAPALVDADGSLQPNCRRFPTPGTLALRALHMDSVWRTSGLRQYLMSGWDHAESAEVDWVTGAVLTARREAIDAVGPLDERYFLYWEDLDWCYRMRRAGWKVCYVPQARAIHVARREGVRRPFSRAGREQLLGAVRFFCKFGWHRTSQQGGA